MLRSMVQHLYIKQQSYKLTYITYKRLENID